MYCIVYTVHTGLPTKDKTVKTTQNSNDMTISSLFLGFCIQICNLMVYLTIKQRNKLALAYKEPSECNKTDSTIPCNRL